MLPRPYSTEGSRVLAFAPFRLFRYSWGVACFRPGRPVVGGTRTRPRRCLGVATLSNIEHQDFARDLKVDSDIAGLEYKEVVPIILKLTAPGASLENAGNLKVWRALLETNAVALSYFPRRRGLRALWLPIRLYISIEDGECRVERALGA